MQELSHSELMDLAWPEPTGEQQQQGQTVPTDKDARAEARWQLQQQRAKIEDQIDALQEQRNALLHQERKYHDQFI